MAEKPSERFYRWFFALKPVTASISVSKKIVLPGFDGLSVHDVAVFFIEGIQKGAIRSRASSIAFNFFLAIFPAILFFFTLIPYLPIQHFEQSLMNLLAELIPEHAFITIESTITDVLTHRQGGLVSIGFLMAAYFATSGIHSIIEAFNISIHARETRTLFRQRVASAILVLILSVLTIAAIFLITAGKAILDFLFAERLLFDWTYYYLLLGGNWLIIMALIYFAFAVIYYFGPAKTMRFKFFSPGSTLATLLAVASSVGFNYYVSNFSRYNAIYGSIGTLIIILLWIYFNASILLIGFELNASIIKAGKHKKK